MKLISMVDYVLENPSSNAKLINYANFLKQPLTLGMFVPCDKDGNVLIEPFPLTMGKCINKRKRLYEPIYDISEVEKYKKAKDKVLFEGFQLVEKYSYGFLLQMFFEDFSEIILLMHEETIEDLLTHSFDPEFTITESAIKTYGL